MSSINDNQAPFSSKDSWLESALISSDESPKSATKTYGTDSGTRIATNKSGDSEAENSHEASMKALYQ